MAVDAFVRCFVGCNAVRSVEDMAGLDTSSADLQSRRAFGARSSTIGIDNSHLHAGLIARSETIDHPWLDSSQAWRIDRHADTVVGEYPVFANVVDDSLHDLRLVGVLNPQLSGTSILDFLSLDVG
jgi:hypothetical protein